jgi:hypothetical protein
MRGAVVDFLSFGWSPTFNAADVCVLIGVVMPIVLLLRLLGTARWPVQINRKGEHFATRYADDFAAATTLRDEVADRIEVGDLPVEEAAPSADSTPSKMGRFEP